MKTHSNQPIADWLEDFRAQAIKAKVPPAVIDKIDELLGHPAYDAELEKLGDELTDMEKNRDDLQEALELLVKACLEEDESPTVKHPAMIDAENALSRSGT